MRFGIRRKPILDAFNLQPTAVMVRHLFRSLNNAHHPLETVFDLLHTRVYHPKTVQTVREDVAGGSNAHLAHYYAISEFVLVRLPLRLRASLVRC